MDEDNEAPKVPSISLLPDDAKSNRFLVSVCHHFDRVLQYEDKEAQDFARLLIPEPLLQEKAKERVKESRKRLEKGDVVRAMGPAEAFLIELMGWFSDEFFEWVDSPVCSHCLGPTKFADPMDHPKSTTSHKLEVYICLLCGSETDFPRLDDAAQLLITRRGRSDEWANCFALMCRASGYQARFVVDSTDHYWTEVFIEAHNRWIHCDPSENAYDTPLMYESGWGKKLSYVMAYSRSDIQDVTWRYCSRHLEVLPRRSECSESELLNTIMTLRESRWRNLPPIYENSPKFLKMCLINELLELLYQREAKDDEKISRVSGSLAWRTQRHEAVWLPYTWTLTDCDQCCIRYQPSLDIYQLVVDRKVVKKIQGWNGGVYEACNIIRKEELEEQDNKMVYLTREEEADDAEISWKVDVGKSSKCIDQLNITVSSASCLGEKIIWVLKCQDEEVVVPVHNDDNFSYICPQDLTEFTLKVYLSKGRVPLFAQKLSYIDEYPLQIWISLK